MPSETKVSLNEVVEYIVTPPFHNISDTADHFGVSRSTISKYLKRLSTIGDEYFDLAKAEQVNEVLEHLLSLSRANSGRSSHRNFTFTEDEALELRYKNVYMRISVRDLASQYGCSHMTVYNAINNISADAKTIQDEEVKRLLEESKEVLFEIGDSSKKWKR